MVVEDEEVLSEARGGPGIEWFLKHRCGVVKGKVKLMDDKRKMMMLYDERIICFDEFVESN